MPATRPASDAVQPPVSAPTATTASPGLSDPLATNSPATEASVGRPGAWRWQMPRFEAFTRSFAGRANAANDLFNDDFEGIQHPFLAPPVKPDAWLDYDVFDDGTKFTPQAWNQLGVLRKNNCYAYAANQPTGTFPQPGLAAGQQYTRLQCESVTKAAIADGFKPIDYDGALGDGEWKVALVVAPGQDYHWYREHPNGMWTHKPGRTEATEFDKDDKRITDPRIAARGIYTDFCGCFKANGSEKIA